MEVNVEIKIYKGEYFRLISTYTDIYRGRFEQPLWYKCNHVYGIWYDIRSRQRQYLDYPVFIINNTLYTSALRE